MINEDKGSCLSIGVSKYFWLCFKTALLVLVPLGLCIPLAITIYENEIARYTKINGRQIKFIGKPEELFYKNLLWLFLSIITFGIYSFWYERNLYRWIVRNTVFEDSKPDDPPSEFYGTVSDLFLVGLQVFFTMLFTLGLALPWSIVKINDYLNSETYINGQGLAFNGTGGSYIRKYIKWYLLSIITAIIFSIVAYFIPIEWYYYIYGTISGTSTLLAYIKISPWSILSSITMDILSFFASFEILKWIALHRVYAEKIASTIDLSKMEKIHFIDEEAFLLNNATNKNLRYSDEKMESFDCYYHNDFGYEGKVRPIKTAKKKFDFREYYNKNKKKVLIMTISICIGIGLLPFGIIAIKDDIENRIELREDGFETFGRRLVRFTKDKYIVNIPDFITHIDQNAFQNRNVKEIYFSEDSELRYIANYAFNNCQIETIQLPKSVRKIENNAFYICTKLKEITVDEDSEYYSSDENGVLFNKDKTTLIQYPTGNINNIYNIPESVTSIVESTFSYCASIEKVYISDNVTKIGPKAFEECDNLTIYYEGSSIPNSWDANWNLSDKTVLFNKCGMGTISGMSYEIYRDGNGDKYIGIVSFDNLEESVCIPSAIDEIPVTSIMDSAFANCGNLYKIFIPNTITHIGYRAFRNDSKIIIYCQSLDAQEGWDEEWNFDGYLTYWNCSGWGETDDGIIYAAFLNNTYNKYIEIIDYDDSLSEVEIPSTILYAPVTKIGRYAFSKCKTLTVVEIPKSVITVESYAFFESIHLTIRCEEANKPYGWNSLWNPNNRPVEWGYTG